MGAWGIGIFENDDACDFAADVAEGRDITRVESTLDRVVGAGSGYLESPDGSEALAAADIVARLKGQYGEKGSYTETIDNWVAAVKITPSNQLIDKARRAASRVLSEPSELMALWQESEEFEEWKASVEALLERLA